MTTASFTTTQSASIDERAETLLEDLIPHLKPDQSWLAEHAGFWDALWHNRPPETLMIVLAGKPLPGHDIAIFNLAEQWHHPKAMLYEHLRGMVATARRSDGLAVPRLRANLGTGFIPSVFGIEQLIFTDKMPWPQGHLSKEAIAALEPDDFDDVADKGLMPYALEIYRTYHHYLGTHAWSYLPDTQGILDIAHLVRGDDIFLDPYDDPAFMHHLMECCLHAYIAISRTIKDAIGEPLDQSKHGCMVQTNGGVRYCMDASVLCRGDMLETYELPYLHRVLEAFGGGWIHFCGYAPQLTPMLCAEPLVRGINPNYMHNHHYDYVDDMRQIQDADKFFIGAPFRTKGQTLEAYFDEVLAPLEQPANLALQPRGEGMTESVSEIKKTWQLTVKRRFG